jgi:hypothetical protein
MSRHLGELLKGAVPEPARVLNADELMRTARSRNAPPRWAGPVVATVFLVAAVAIAVPQVVARWGHVASTPGVADVPLRLSALDRRVPLGPVAVGAMDRTALAHPGEGSLVATLGQEQVYLIEAVGDQLCLLEVNESYGSAGSGCFPRSDLLTTGIVLSTLAPDSSTMLLAVAVPDGYTVATSGGRSAVVVSNVAVLDLVSSQTKLTVSGSAMPSVTFDLGKSAILPGGSAPETPGSAAKGALSDLARSAQLYAQEHGSTAGFADKIKADAGPVVSTKFRSLTDTSAVADLGAGRRLTVDLLSGAIDEGAC